MGLAIRKTTDAAVECFEIHAYCPGKDDQPDVLCPGDWIVKDQDGSSQIVKPGRFKAEYELIAVDSLEYLFGPCNLPGGD